MLLFISYNRDKILRVVVYGHLSLEIEGTWDTHEMYVINYDIKVADLR